MTKVFDGFYQMIKELELTSGKKEKVEIIKKWVATNPTSIKGWIQEALHPRILFYMRQMPNAYQPLSTSVMTELDVLNLLDSLSSRKVTGNMAEDAVRRALNLLDYEDGQMLMRILQKDLKCGANSGTFNKALGEGFIPEFDIGLSEQYDEERVKFPCIGQPKIDGLRVVAFVGTDRVDYFSRSGKPFDTLESLTPNILASFTPGTVLDGEVTSDSFLESISAVKRKTAKKDGEHNIVYFIFDIMSQGQFDSKDCPATQEYRLKMLDEMFDIIATEGRNPQNIKTIPWKLLHNAEELDEYYTEALDAGWEGLMVKQRNAGYHFKRGYHWMKIKPEKSYDLEITGFIEGKKGGKTDGMLGAITYDYNGYVGKVGTGFSLELRQQIWDARDQLIGDLIEVEAMERSGKGMVRLQHPRFKRFRTYKGEKV